MALDISSATIGYDTQGIAKFIDMINIQVVKELTAKIDQTIPTLREEVDKVWVGQAANAFKNKLEKDSVTMKQTLEQLENNLRGQFAQIAKNVDTYDQQQAEAINSQG